MKLFQKFGISLILLLSLLSPITSAAERGAGDNSILVPFKLERNRVIIPARVNDSKEMDIILDTGMRFDGIYLFHEELIDQIDTTGAIEVRVPGAGAGEASTALMIETGRLQFGDVVIDSQKVIISRSSHTQTFPTDGVFGWNLFGHYTVEIDYDKKTIFLHDTTEFKPDSSWQAVPITLKEDIPFLEATVEVVNGEKVDMSLYIDLASGDALELLVKPDQKFTMPDSLEQDYLGTGLSGDIYGQRGRIPRLNIASYDLLDVSTAFAPAEVRSKQEGADGILGNDAIRRFNVIFDYSHQLLYIKPNSYLNLPFEQVE
jgi:hypothetical protein